MLEPEIGEEKLRRGIGFARSVEGEVDIAIAERLFPDVVDTHPVAAALIGLDRLVDYVPFADLAGIAAHRCLDIATEQFFAVARIGARHRGFEPWRIRRVPDKRVPARGEPVLLRKVDQLVVAAEIVDPRLGLGDVALELILLDDHPGLAQHRRCKGRILGDLARLDRAAEAPSALSGVSVEPRPAGIGLRRHEGYCAGGERDAARRRRAGDEGTAPHIRAPRTRLVSAIHRSAALR
jgi:hypothetical protein